MFSQHNFDQFRQNPSRRHDLKYRSESRSDTDMIIGQRVVMMSASAALTLTVNTVPYDGWKIKTFRCIG